MTSVADSINDAGQAVGVSQDSFGRAYAVEWSGGKVIDLGGLPGSTFSEADSINDAGQVVGDSVVDGVDYAVEWSHGKVINLDGLSGSPASFASGINNAGQVVGASEAPPPIPPAIPESSTWVMMVFGFGGLALAGYRRGRLDLL
jgi:probable HAF family extracellular repeat protein